ncbi:hypothetical protein MASR2M78_26350 [Treponema sp.]
MLFRRSILLESIERKGTSLALVTGLVFALLGTLIFPLIPVGSFGLERWISIFLTRTSFPPLLALGIWYLLKRYRSEKTEDDAVDFSLVFLIPTSAFRAVSWNSSGDPSSLVASPFLWAAIIIGIPYLIEHAEEEFGFLSFIFILMAIALPLLAASASWAFFRHNLLLGMALFIITLVPAVFSIAKDYLVV